LEEPRSPISQYGEATSLNVPHQSNARHDAGPAQPHPCANEALAGGRDVSVSAELIADIVEATRLVAADRLRAARDRAGNGSLAQALIDEGLASSAGVARALAERYHLPYVEILSEQPSPDALEQIPIAVLERTCALPYKLSSGVLMIAIGDPGNIAAIDELRLATRFAVELGVASRDDIVTEISRIAKATEALNARVRNDIDIELIEDEDEDDLEVDDGVSDAPLVRLVNSIVFQAAEDGASDVHIEPQEDCLLVRFRIDGVLHETQRIPKRLANGVTTRLKVLSKLDIAERRKPQDGRISLNAAAAGRTLDIRVATLPTVEGECVVMRLLDKSKRAPTLEELGMSEQMRAGLRDIVKRPTGALLVTGPTGSGKSTTLYAALTEINRPEINIVTVEDPVEYRLAGVNQVQINQRAGLTFASALRSILRSDPDVVMVGEIRDGETAKISIEAALTGHLVLSTLHTNDAPSAITRLNEMGVEPFLTGSAVSAVLAQRLARKLCSFCCEIYSPSVDELLKARVSPDIAASQDGAAFYRKVGCPRCNQSGYKGRLGIFQFMTMGEEIERLAVAKASRDEVERAALAMGMRSLWDDGLAKVAAGLTSVEELARVVAT
jgi:type IV pilus assembly protein PilB